MTDPVTQTSPVTEQILDLPGGITITVRRATVRSNALARSLRQRFGQHFADLGQELSEYFGYFVVCAPYVSHVTGSKWRAPGMFDDLPAVQRSFEGWMELLPNIDAMMAWIEAVGAVNGAANDDELTPDFDPETADATDPK